jgi:hypothetical protein
MRLVCAPVVAGRWHSLLRLLLRCQKIDMMKWRPTANHPPRPPRRPPYLHASARRTSTATPELHASGSKCPLVRCCTPSCHELLGDLAAWRAPGLPGSSPHGLCVQNSSPSQPCRDTTDARRSRGIRGQRAGECWAVWCVLRHHGRCQPASGGQRTPGGGKKRSGKNSTSINGRAVVS